MPNKFAVTYEIVTPESAVNGEVADSGFVGRGDWRQKDREEMSLRQALQLCYPAEDCGHWFTEIDGRPDYQTGAEERRSLHPPRHLSAASYARLKRLLKIK